MPDPSRRVKRGQPRVFGSGVSNAAPDPASTLDSRPYRYKGRDTEPDPLEIAAQVRAEIARRNGGSEGEVTA